MTDTQTKPLLFGDKTYDVERLAELDVMDAQGFDASYVPGYGELRRANEIAASKGEPRIPHDFLYWIRSSRVDGTDVSTSEMVTHYRNGYQACTAEDLEERGWGFPPAAHKAADGSIRREDLVLAIVGKERAKLNKERQERKNAEFHGVLERDPEPRPGISVSPGTSEVHKNLNKGDLANFLSD